MNPKRIQLSRKKGWKMPPNTVVVSRPSKWGNPFNHKAHDDHGAHEMSEIATCMGGVQVDIEDRPYSAAESVKLYRWWMGIQTKLNPREIRGKNLACWCKIGEPCHADVLLEIANKRDGE